MMVSISMPQLIPPVSFGLDELAERQKLLKHLDSRNSKHVVGQVHGQDIKATDTRAKTGYFWVTDPTTNDLVFVVNWVQKNMRPLPGRIATQTAVWSSLTSMYSVDAAKTVFFNHVLALTGVAVTDEQQTDYGRRFWLNRIANAFDSGMKVYFLVVGSKLEQLHTQADVQEHLKYWGDTPNYRKYRFAIVR